MSWKLTLKKTRRDIGKWPTKSERGIGASEKRAGAFYHPSKKLVDQLSDIAQLPASEYTPHPIQRDDACPTAPPARE